MVKFLYFIPKKPVLINSIKPTRYRERRCLMRIRHLTTATILILLFIFAACQSREPAEPEVQPSCDRACLENYVDQYMDAMFANEVSETLFARDCVFTENGVRLPLGNEGLWASMVGKGTYRFYVPDVETRQIGFFDPIFTAVIPEDERPSREEMIRIANYYFTGMQKNDGKGIEDTGTYPFTDDCDRYENGMRSTNVPLAPGQEMPDPLKETVYSSHWGCKQQFESGLIHFVTRIRDRRFVAVDRERGIVFSFCFFDHSAGESRHFATPDGRQVIAGPAEPWTWQIAELFKIEKGNIRRIEAILQRCPYGMNSGWSSYEDGLSDKMQIIK